MVLTGTQYCYTLTLFFDVIFSDIILHFLELMTALKNEMDLKLNY
jgi:hypothetical protein